RYGNNLIPVIDVSGAFMGGGADIGEAYNRQNFSELQNTTSWQGENHILKFGVQARDTRQIDGSTQNFGGTYTFASRVAPQLNSSNEVVKNPDDTPVMITISTIEAYRRTMFFLQQGLSPEEVRKLGGGASQFSITAGNPQTAVRQYQGGAFFQD